MSGYMNRVRTRSYHRQLSKDDMKQVVELVLQKNHVIEDPIKTSQLKEDIINVLTEKIIDPWLSDINRTIGDMVTELEAEKDLRASYERQCLNLEIQRELSHQTELDVKQNKLSLPVKGSKYSKSRLLCVPSGWSTSQDGSLNVVAEIDILKSKIEQLENVNQELKEEITRELESLSQALFEEANKMVADETRLRSELEKSNNRLSKALQLSLTRLHDIMYENWSEIWANYGIKLKRTTSWQTSSKTIENNSDSKADTSCPAKGIARTTSDTMGVSRSDRKKMTSFLRHFNASKELDVARTLPPKPVEEKIIISGDLLTTLNL